RGWMAVNLLHRVCGTIILNNAGERRRCAWRATDGSTDASRSIAMMKSRLFVLAAATVLFASAGRAVADDKSERPPSISDLHDLLQKTYGAGLDKVVELPADKWFDQLAAKGIPLQFDLSAFRRRGVDVPDLSSIPVRFMPSP